MIEPGWRGLDYTYCGSPKCQNKCGRKLIVSDELKKSFDVSSPDWNKRIWYGYFCDENGEINYNAGRKSE